MKRDVIATDQPDGTSVTVVSEIKDGHLVFQKVKCKKSEVLGPSYQSALAIAHKTLDFLLTQTVAQIKRECPWCIEELKAPPPPPARPKTEEEIRAEQEPKQEAAKLPDIDPRTVRPPVKDYDKLANS